MTTVPGREGPPVTAIAAVGERERERERGWVLLGDAIDYCPPPSLHIHKKQHIDHANCMLECPSIALVTI